MMEYSESYMQTYGFLEGYSCAMHMRQTLAALGLAEQFHKDQYREDGQPYLTHPISVALTLLQIGLSNDELIASALLHDVIEDCSYRLPMQGQELSEEYNISTRTVEIVKLLTKKKHLSEEEISAYFLKIRASPEASLIKLADRLHNLTTIYVFDISRMKKYVRETQFYVIPLAEFGKLHHIQYFTAYSVLENQIKGWCFTYEEFFRWAKKTSGGENC